ncbi:uncharacterized protein L969DRAFT_45716 [Mixia osmundae IAM 14324]|uniref:Amine oxidase domain-containing protein n=1 Tax=Mixia osmundae (strain CBS 9802 / IAM 14324 / JCM 22182 / KY 12970) TaxID=764103 RepID=G7DXW4_MIXOS|nr:uncharacterized protein L969DRAFT_45716 [Mixia osmundae IAM 14324]KEI41327.1 hypothetical protein L969DRAFT_45716 [Mixia osmundae IAM 14324]GAA95424.1 hypothetical protein E5Q_02078 [Mixia osmundae IAM 14324]
MLGRLGLLCLLSALQIAAAPASASAKASSTATASSSSSSSSSKQNAKVLILGAGVAGITAAINLQKAGVTDWLIIDAEPQIGGRMQSQKLANGLVVERGPNWVQGLNSSSGFNPIWRLALDANLSTSISDFSNFTAYNLNGKAKGVDDLYDQYSDAFANFLSIAGTKLDQNQFDYNARGGLFRAGWNPLTPEARAVEAYNYDMEFAQSPSDSSWTYSSVNTNDTFNLFSADNALSIDQRGFSVILEHEFAPLNASSKLRLNTTVKKVAYSTSGVSVTTTGGQKFTGDYAICTFSVGVLQNSDVTFSPSFPVWKQDAIDSFAMAVYTKIFITFTEKFWAANDQFALYVDPAVRARYVQFQFLDVEDFFPGSKTLFVTALGDQAVAVEARSEQDVQDEIVGILKGMYGNKANIVATSIYYPRWHSDPLYRGSYSNWPAGYSPLSQENLRAGLPAGKDARLLFAGEALSYQWYGFLHGAYYSALDTTNGLIDSFKTSKLNESYYPVVYQSTQQSITF